MGRDVTLSYKGLPRTNPPQSSHHDTIDVVILFAGDHMPTDMVFNAQALSYGT